MANALEQQAARRRRALEVFAGAMHQLQESQRMGLPEDASRIGAEWGKYLGALEPVDKSWVEARIAQGSKGDGEDPTTEPVWEPSVPLGSHLSLVK